MAAKKKRRVTRKKITKKRSVPTKKRRVVRKKYSLNPTKPSRYVGIAQLLGPHRVYGVIFHGGKEDELVALYDNKKEARDKSILTAIERKVPVKLVSSTGRVEFRTV